VTSPGVGSHRGARNGQVAVELSSTGFDGDHRPAQTTRRSTPGSGIPSKLTATYVSMLRGRARRHGSAGLVRRRRPRAWVTQPRSVSGLIPSGSPIRRHALGRDAGS
jgi:hypothetical protein